MAAVVVAAAAVKRSVDPGELLEVARGAIEGVFKDERYSQGFPIPCDGVYLCGKRPVEYVKAIPKHGALRGAEYVSPESLREWYGDLAGGRTRFSAYGSFFPDDATVLEGEEPCDIGECKGMREIKPVYCDEVTVPSPRPIYCCSGCMSATVWSGSRGGPKMMMGSILDWMPLLKLADTESDHVCVNINAASPWAGHAAVLIGDSHARHGMYRFGPLDSVVGELNQCTGGAEALIEAKGWPSEFG